jgi:RNA polymerase sigma-70 factor (ECF subfamily)
VVAGDELVGRAQSGDRAALDELCRREWKPVYAIAYRSVRNVGEAQDITQEVFVRALRSLHRFEDTGAPFSVYLATIARNLVRDRWRKHRPQMVEFDTAAKIPSPADTPEEQALQSIDRDELRRAIGLLSVDHRTVLQLRINDGRSAAEVGQIMGRSPDAIRQLQHRAVAALRSHLQEGCRT